MKVVNINERRYRDFPWCADPSPREGVRDDEHRPSFSERCATNAIESLARAFAGTPLHPRQYTDGKGNLFWRKQ